MKRKVRAYIVFQLLKKNNSKNSIIGIISSRGNFFSAVQGLVNFLSSFTAPTAFRGDV